MLRGVECTARGEHLHHRQLRSQGGRHTVPNLVHICHACHEWIHANPRDAAECGFIVRRGADPAAVAVLRRSRWVLLDDSGGVEPTGQDAPLTVLSNIDWGETLNWQ
ncbi:hypothetical protein QVA66_03810 [Staphylococcus chromogenes]|nr:hypothetical protein [Staphylococcus chromogenes]